MQIKKCTIIYPLVVLTKNKKMKKIFLYCFLSALLLSCSQHKKWVFEKEIQLNNVHPIGITKLNNQIWVSDGNENRLIRIDFNGKILSEISGFERPMHICNANGNILIPEYGRDSITIFQPNHSKKYMSTPKLDAPASVHQWNDEIAIADFYNHRVLFKENNNWLVIGKKGSDNKEFNYPTDVQITNTIIFVADAYNHRVQLFSKDGKHLKTIGEEFEMNASTGIYVHKEELFITDFENNRVISSNIKGELLQELKTSIEKPTDVLVIDNKLWILNFKKGSISLYTR